MRDALPEQRRGAIHEAVAAALIVRRDAGADVPAAQIAHHALAAARAGADPQPAWEAALEAAREAAATLGHAEAARALRRGARGARARRRGAGRRAPRDAARARRRDVRRRRHRGRPPPLRAGRGRRAPRRRRGGARRGRARVLAGPPVRRGRHRRASTLLSQALERLPADGALRARVTGLLAVFEPDQERREALIDEALATARRLATRRTLGWLYPAAVIVNWRPERAAQRAEAAEEVVRAAAQHADHGALVWAYLHRIRDAMQAGDVARADADLDRARPVAHATRRTSTAGS